MSKLSILKEFFEFLKSRKNVWLTIAALFLLLLAALVFLSQGSVVAPFIYTIF